MKYDDSASEYHSYSRWCCLQLWTGVPKWGLIIGDVVRTDDCGEDTCTDL